MPIKKTIATLTIFISGIIIPPVAFATDSLEKVRLQLRWHHQFQFAGYYAAKAKGYYEEAGFDVEIISGNTERQPVNELLNHRAEFAEGNSEVLLARLEGKPLIALAAIYQRSPSILLSRSDSAIRTPKDLQGKTVMLVNGVNSQDSDLLAMLHTSNIPLDKFNIIPSSYDVSDLSNGKVDAFNAYITNEPFFLEEQNIRYQFLRPSDYGIDFYSDILFTSEERIKKNPDSANRFLAASLKGWTYALDHPEEIIKVIKNEYLSTKSLNHLRFEANAVRELILPELIPIGDINDQRIQKMATTLIHYNPTLSNDALATLNHFVFSPTSTYTRFLYWLPYGLALLISGVILLLCRNHRLNKEIRQRICKEKSLTLLATIDHLTKLYNTRSYQLMLSKAIKQSRRTNKAFSLIAIDIDFFKPINDSYGHPVGDKILRLFAQRMSETLRETDSCARTGGEEFIIILPDTELAQAEQLAERTRLHIEQAPFQVASLSIAMTASLGVTQWHPDDKKNEPTIRADKALYEAKHAGRNCIRSL